MNVLRFLIFKAVSVDRKEKYKCLLRLEYPIQGTERLKYLFFFSKLLIPLLCDSRALFYKVKFLLLFAKKNCRVKTICASNPFVMLFCV